jgi:pimeloyl-ACP methyl ester carboxylesterase
VTRPDGARIHYEVPGQGTPMLLIHGYPLSGELFAKNRDAMSKRFRVIALDQRGLRQSTTPNDEASVEIYAQDALAVLDELKVDKAIIGGMSMGSPVVFEMYRKVPQRFTGLMLIDTTAKPANPGEAGLWDGMAKLVQDKDVAALPPVLLKDLLTGETRQQKKPEAAALRRTPKSPASRTPSIR